MRRLKKEKKPMSMKAQLLVALLSGISILIILISTVSFARFRETMVSEIGKNRADVLRQIAERVQQVRNNEYTLSNLYYNDATLRGLMKQIKASGSSETVKEFKAYCDRVTNQYKNSFFDEGSGYQVVISLENGDGYTSSEAEQVEEYNYMNPKGRVWYKKMLAAEGGPIEIANFKDDFSGKSYFSIVRVMGRSKNTPDGYLMINIEETQIYDMYTTMLSDKNNIIYVVDQSGVIISSSNRNLLGFQYFHMRNLDKLFDGDNFVFTKMQDREILLTRYLDEKTGFTILEEIPLASLMTPIYKIRRLVTMITVIVMGMAIAYSVFLANRMSMPLRTLCDFISRVNGENLDEVCAVEGYKEINILSDNLNVMLDNIKKLVQDIIDSEAHKRDAELKFLQSQINPHFVYNTLFSIKCMLNMNENEAAASMITSFSRLLRSTLSDPREYVAVEEEFELLKQYTAIQKLRYNDNFEVYFECDNEAAKAKMPKLLVQPLLENSIFHGMEPLWGEGVIVVIAKKIDDNLTIIIEDNGVGIPPEVLNNLNSGIIAKSNGHIGIGNVKERMQLIYGNSCRMKIESEPNCGTKITMIMPIIDI